MVAHEQTLSEEGDHMCNDLMTDVSIAARRCAVSSAAEGHAVVGHEDFNK